MCDTTSMIPDEHILDDLLSHLIPDSYGTKNERTKLRNLFAILALNEEASADQMDEDDFVPFTMNIFSDELEPEDDEQQLKIILEGHIRTLREMLLIETKVDDSRTLWTSVAWEVICERSREWSLLSPARNWLDGIIEEAAREENEDDDQ